MVKKRAQAVMIDFALLSLLHTVLCIPLVSMFAYLTHFYIDGIISRALCVTTNQLKREGSKRVASSVGG